MIGVFTTTEYASRRDFDEQRPCGLHVCRNGYTLVGMEWIWNMCAGYLRSSDGTLNDHLGAARIVVGSGDMPHSYDDTRLAGEQTAQAELDQGYPLIRRVIDDDPQGVEIVFRSTFGEDNGVFDWQERGVVSAQGVLIDRAVDDRGRKPLGAVWQIEAALRVTG